MNYSTIIPNRSVQTVVECFWVVDGVETEQQKIIPDGFPEIIFHFADPYLIFDSDGNSEMQQRVLVSGQLSRPIRLQPCGRSDVFGIKFKPTGIWKLLGLDMSTVRDEVVGLTDNESLAALHEELKPLSSEERVRCVEDFILMRLKYSEPDETDAMVSTIENHKGNVSIEELCHAHHVTPRTLQRIFQQQIGITAKQYARIVRFKTVYALLQKPSLTKSDSIFLSGYFDQPHFNKEFREFTEENPEKWFSGPNSFSNFFMNR